MSDGWWELIFLMFVMKIPILYLIGVVWWAVRAQPDPYAPATLVRAVLTDPPPEHPARACPWRGRHPRPRPPTPPARAPRRAALARAAR